MVKLRIGGSYWEIKGNIILNDLEFREKAKERSREYKRGKRK